MAKITWKNSDGSSISAEVENGISLMEAGVNLNVVGVYGDCGGALSCATCHCVVDDAWHDRVPAASAMETEMLEMVEVGRSTHSRLSCQIRVSDELDGLVLHTVA